MVCLQQCGPWRQPRSAYVCVCAYACPCLRGAPWMVCLQQCGPWRQPRSAYVCVHMRVHVYEAPLKWFVCSSEGHGGSPEAHMCVCICVSMFTRRPLNGLSAAVRAMEAAQEQMCGCFSERKSACMCEAPQGGVGAMKRSVYSMLTSLYAGHMLVRIRTSTCECLHASAPSGCSTRQPPHHCRQGALMHPAQQFTKGHQIKACTNAASFRVRHEISTGRHPRNWEQEGCPQHGSRQGTHHITARRVPTT